MQKIRVYLSNGWSEVKPDDLAVLIYTSGTTGPPKGAMLTHSNLLYMSEAMVDANPIHDGDETLSYLPLCHIFEQLFTVMINIRYRDGRQFHRKS